MNSADFGMVSGLPAFPIPTIRPSRTPMSALTIPVTASMIIACGAILLLK